MSLKSFQSRIVSILTVLENFSHEELFKFEQALGIVPSAEPALVEVPVNVNPIEVTQPDEPPVIEEDALSIDTGTPKVEVQPLQYGDVPAPVSQ